jgi:hypothetical protein
VLKQHALADADQWVILDQDNERVAVGHCYSSLSWSEQGVKVI